MNPSQGQPLKFGSLVSYMIKTEGFSSMYKGFTTNFMRLGLFNCALWVSLEQIKLFFNRRALISSKEKLTGSEA